MWLLDRFRNPVWHQASRLGKADRRVVATVLCSYDFFRQQAEKKLVGPAEAFLHDSQNTTGSAELALIRQRLALEALLGLSRCCHCPPFDPGRKLPPNIVSSLPELWAGFVLADMNQASAHSSDALGQAGYSQQPDQAHAQVLLRWKEILGVTDPAFESQVNDGGFEKEWNWLVEMFVSDTLQGMAIIPDRMLFAQARRVAAAASPQQAQRIEHFITQVASERS